ncbi:hypothetical protein BDV29DRAFT_165567 [Aspergillus leporis]|uniref:PARP-type domain-containing protein n=1 Tax=Aspergillus leporis TaxID=41062 RepID=A0A5N5XIK4_9EURO|nr:hypothetical protein BDV29DRAFT_165567 [Aspergillus leporis]
MVSYRLEQASTGRAGCQNKECKDQKVKIAKGELRLGSWVDTERIQAFFWRHWGCVTPKIISNLIEMVGEDEDKDYEQLDGFEDLSEENQEKIKKALEQGHVDDEDWKGDVEMNRPGKVGFRKRVSKKQAAAAEDSEAEEKSPEPKPKKRGRQPTKDEADDQTEEAPEAKKTKRTTRGKRVPDANKAAKEESDDDTAPEPDPKPKATRKGRASKKETEEKEPSKAPPKAAAKPAAKRQQKAAAEDDEAEPVEEKPKRGRKKKTAA